MQTAHIKHMHIQNSLLQLKTVYTALLNIFSENWNTKQNTLDLNYTSFVILRMHNSDSGCNLFVIPCANIQKESRANTEEANGFPSNPIST